MALLITDPVTNAPHSAPLKPATAVDIPAAETETYEQMRERFLLRWCREKNAQGWCGTFDNIMVHDLGYTAKEVLEARARFDYQHAFTVTFTAPKKLTKADEKTILDYSRRYVREYFSIENSAGCTGTMEVTSEPPAEPTDLSEIEAEKRRVLKTILETMAGRPSLELSLTTTLGYTTEQVAEARRADRWVYVATLNWHSPSRINYPTDLKRAIVQRFESTGYSLFVTDSTITPGTTIEFN